MRLPSLLRFFLWSGVVLPALVSCWDDEVYSVSSTQGLEFSKDTIAFDTIMTGMATNTYTFQVYNRGEKALRLPQVYLESGKDSPFRVNVDGTFLENGAATDFEVSGGDSLRVFLFLNAPERDQDHPFEITDKLIFQTEGGVREEVVLNAYGQDVIRLKDKYVKDELILSANRPYHLTDSLIVEPGATLMLDKGVRLYFHTNASLVVRGTLLALGEQNAPILMRGDRLGYMFSDQPYDRIPGQWGGIVFETGSYGNIIDHCDIHSGFYGIRCDSSDVSVPVLFMENSIVHNVTGDALNVRHSQVYVGNSQITNAGGNCVTLRGGHTTFVHCTIGNFYAFAGGRGVALDFANYEGDVRLPLHSAAFYNCIVTGYSADDIMGSQSERYPEDAFNYYFHHCLLNTPEFEDPRISHCYWDSNDQAVYREKNFSPDFDLDKLIFTFGLHEESQAIGTADSEITKEFYPQDLKGHDRFSEGAPDLGCYERVGSAEDKNEKE